MKGKLFIIVGPSGSGKSSVLMEFKKRHPEYTYPLSATTRPMREGEKDGDIYHFYTKERFEEGLSGAEVVNLAQAESLETFLRLAGVEPDKVETE